MDLPEDLRHLVLGWMQTEHSVKVQQKAKVAQTYFNAMKSLRQYPTPIKHPNELKHVKFFGGKTIEFVSSKLKAYCEEYGYEYPQLSAEEIEKEKQEELKNLEKENRKKAKETLANSRKRKKQDESPNSSDESDDETSGKKKKTKKAAPKPKKQYIPEINSGGYSILMALYINDKHESGMTKAEVIKYATPYCTSSFQTNPATGNFYSAWSSVNTLIKREYVIAEGTPKYYSLTDTGKEVAKVLKEMYNQTEGIIEPRKSVTPHTSESTPLNKNKNKNKNSINHNLQVSKNPLESSSPVVQKRKLGDDSSILSSSPFRGGILNDIKQKRQNITLSTIPSSPLTTTTAAATVATKSHTTEINNSNSRSEYQIWKKGTYDIKFLLDNREVFSREERNHFSNALKDMGVNIEVRALPVGDGTWIAINKHTKQETTLNFIFERKRLDDLAGSILDGRFREQKTRLERTGMKTIFYIVEEQMGSDISKYADSIKTCISMNTTYSGFHTMRTKDPDQTINLINEITNLINKLYSNKTLLVLEPRSLTTQEEYRQTLENMREQFSNDKEVVYSYNTFSEIMGKTSMLRVKDVFVKFLMTTKGVSLEKASTIQSHYKTPRNLILAFNRCHERDPKECATLIQKELDGEVGIRRVGAALSGKLATVWCKGCARKTR